PIHDPGSEGVSKRPGVHDDRRWPQSLGFKRQETKRGHEPVVRHRHIAPLQLEYARAGVVPDLPPLVAADVLAHVASSIPRAPIRGPEASAPEPVYFVNQAPLCNRLPKGNRMDTRVAQVEAAMALIGSRWRPAIMFALNVMGTQRFSALRRLIPGVSQRMLTKQLRDLERHGLVRRQFFESV